MHGDVELSGSAVDAASGVSLLAVAGLASIAAGAIHAAAIGGHADHATVVIVFTVVAAAQIGWGAVVLALRMPHRALAALGVVGAVVAIGGWVMAKTWGIGFIDGLGDPEPVQLADGLAAALAAVSGLVSLACVVSAPQLGRTGRSRRALLAASAPVGVLAVAGMIAAGSHAHAGAGHGVTASNPGAFVPKEGVDLSGVPGVSPSEQAEAERLVDRTLVELPQFADIASLNDKGFYSIGDAITGDEHYVNWSYVNDGVILDPSRPESVVIRHRNGTQKLVAAMFMLPEGTTLDEVPSLGGPLLQWHVHADLCFTPDPVRPVLAFADLFVGTERDCTPPNLKRGDTPMVHVWIVSNPCGPFAALEGIGAGQITDGESRLCTSQHAHVSAG